MQCISKYQLIEIFFHLTHFEKIGSGNHKKISIKLIALFFKEFPESQQNSRGAVGSENAQIEPSREGKINNLHELIHICFIYLLKCYFIQYTYKTESINVPPYTSVDNKLR